MQSVGRKSILVLLSSDWHLTSFFFLDIKYTNDIDYVLLYSSVSKPVSVAVGQDYTGMQPWTDVDTTDRGRFLL